MMPSGNILSRITDIQYDTAIAIFKLVNRLKIPDPITFNGYNITVNKRGNKSMLIITKDDKTFTEYTINPLVLVDILEYLETNFQ